MLGRTDSRRRLLVLLMIFAVGSMALLARTAYWQVLRGDFLMARAAAQTTVRIEVAGRRGDIYDRTGTVEGSHTPLGDVSLYVDGNVVATRSGVRTHPGSFGLAGGGIAVGRNSGQAVSSRYKAPYPFTGGAIAKVVVDTSGTPYLDVERELAQAFSKD